MGDVLDDAVECLWREAEKRAGEGVAALEKRLCVALQHRKLGVDLREGGGERPFGRKDSAAVQLVAIGLHGVQSG